MGPLKAGFQFAEWEARPSRTAVVCWKTAQGCWREGYRQAVHRRVAGRQRQGRICSRMGLRKRAYHEWFRACLPHRFPAQRTRQGDLFEGTYTYGVIIASRDLPLEELIAWHLSSRGYRARCSSRSNSKQFDYQSFTVILPELHLGRAPLRHGSAREYCDYRSRTGGENVHVER